MEDQEKAYSGKDTSKTKEPGQSEGSEDLLDSDIKEIMSRDIVVAQESDSVKEMLEKFKKHNFHTYPVVDPEGRLVGTIDQDVIMEIILFDRIPRPGHTHMIAIRSLGENARDIMKPDPVTISPDTSLYDAADLMMKHKINRICVVDEGKLAGIISKKDIIKEVYAKRGMD